MRILSRCCSGIVPSDKMYMQLLTYDQSIAAAKCCILVHTCAKSGMIKCIVIDPLELFQYKPFFKVTISQGWEVVFPTDRRTLINGSKRRLRNTVCKNRRHMCKHTLHSAIQKNDISRYSCLRALISPLSDLRILLHSQRCLATSGCDMSHLSP